MDMREIVREWLLGNGYESLECRSYECTCSVRDDDFMLCCPYRGCAVVSDAEPVGAGE